MHKLPVVKGKKLLSFVQSLGFTITSVGGSHVRLKSEDGRRTTIPLHENRDIPKGTLLKITKDLEIDKEEFLRLYSQFRGE